MKKRLFSLAMLLVAVAVNVMAQVVAEADDDAKYATSLLKPGVEAPDFTLQTPSGKQVSLSDYRGHYVVLDFWASWCPDCRKDIPEVKALYEQYKDEAVVFLGVSFDTDKAKWAKCIADNDMAWTQVSPLQKWKTKNADGTQNVLIPVAEDYGVEWIPSMYLIDLEGKVVFGTVMIEKIRDALATISALRASN